MALVFDQINAAIPQTHVFIVAVGNYPHLSGGSDEKQQIYSGLESLGQLSSPAVSAEAFYNTIISLQQENSWIKPLGSIELLVSPAVGSPPVFQALVTERASLANIKRCYREWSGRCNAHNDNVALFFFCGHGLEKIEHFLLPDDFGQDPADPWSGYFAFDMTRRAFNKCKASTQIFLVDACRQITSDMLMLDLPYNPLDTPSLLASECLYNLTIKASAANEAAYSDKNSPSYFTKAMINAFTGHAATSSKGQWPVQLSTIASNMNRFLKHVKASEGYKQRCISYISDSTEILLFPTPPHVDLTVYCDPDEALPFAELSCTNMNTKVTTQRPPQPAPWMVQVPAGIYQLSAAFANPPYQNGQSTISVIPPSVEEKLVCL
jgi:Caspase domain